MKLSLALPVFQYCTRSETVRMWGGWLYACYEEEIEKGTEKASSKCTTEGWYHNKTSIRIGIKKQKKVLCFFYFVFIYKFEIFVIDGGNRCQINPQKTVEVKRKKWRKSSGMEWFHTVILNINRYFVLCASKYKWRIKMYWIIFYKHLIN